MRRLLHLPHPPLLLALSLLVVAACAAPRQGLLPGQIARPPTPTPIPRPLELSADRTAIKLDKVDYDAGDVARFVAAGFQPGETVLLTARGDIANSRLKTEAVADANGVIRGTLGPLPAVLGEVFRLTGTGVSGVKVTALFSVALLYRYSWRPCDHYDTLPLESSLAEDSPDGTRQLSDFQRQTSPP